MGGEKWLFQRSRSRNFLGHCKLLRKGMAFWPSWLRQKAQQKALERGRIQALPLSLKASVWLKRTWVLSLRVVMRRLLGIAAKNAKLLIAVCVCVNFFVLAG